MAAWRVLGLAAGLLLTTSSAWADHGNDGDEVRFERRARPGALGAPEIDPSALGSAAALVVGGIALVAAGRPRPRLKQPQ